jgi:hypothetical protein
MTRISSLLALSAMLFVCPLASSAVQAQGTLTRTFVSSTGVDSNPCTTAQPCATFAAAYAAVASNGIVAALDPGKYGPITITGPVTINGNGWAAITGPSGNTAITITASSGNVILTGLEIDGVGAAEDGIDFYGSASVHVEHSAIRNFTGTGISFSPNGNSQLFVSDTLLNDNGGAGLAITSTNPVTITGVIDHVKAENNGVFGFMTSAFSAQIVLSISNSVAAYNTTTCGVFASSSPGADSIQINVSDSIIQSNSQGVCAYGHTMIVVRSSTIADSTNAGIYASGGATVWATRSTINGNGTGISGTVNSYGDNNLFDNTTQGSFSSTLTYQ